VSEPETVDETAPGGGAMPGAAGGIHRGPALLGIGGLIALFAVFPVLVTDPTTTSIAVFTLIFMICASAWNIFSGYSGYLALGHAVFFGSGGYAVAMAAQSWHVAGGWPVFALLPFGGLIAGLIAIPVGLVALRTRRHTFVVVTIAIFFIFQLAATNFGFTGGTSGMLLPLAPFSAANYNQPFYYVALVLVIATALLSWTVRRSRFGLQLLAIRDDEDRALGLGVRTRRVKLSAFVLSAIPCGMAGGLYFYFVGQIFPQYAFDPLFDLALALMAFLGGLGTIAGPLLGALVLESLQQYLTQTFSNDATYLIAYGVLFLAVILVLPQGVVPGVTTWLARRRAARARTVGNGREPSVRSGVPGPAR
jgi:branched-chain amino acid transport system permease protein